MSVSLFFFLLPRLHRPGTKLPFAVSSRPLPVALRVLASLLLAIENEIYTPTDRALILLSARDSTISTLYL